MNGQQGPSELEQVIPYVGGTGGDPGRRFPISVGLIGEVARTHAPLSMSWDGINADKFISEMVSKYHYTQANAEELVTFRRAWLAVPIAGTLPTETIGVVFLDSSEPKIFTEQRIKMVVGACFGLANYIRERYG